MSSTYFTFHSPAPASSFSLPCFASTLLLRSFLYLCTTLTITTTLPLLSPPLYHTLRCSQLAIAKAPESLQRIEDTGPVPLSYPSILRHPGFTSRYAHFVGTIGPPLPAPAQVKKVWRRNDNEEKRWVRRRKYSTYLRVEFFLLDTRTTMSKRDLELPYPSSRLRSLSPSCRISRAARCKHTTHTGRQGKQCRAGQSLPARQAQGARTEILVRGVEDEVGRWLGEVAAI